MNRAEQVVSLRPKIAVVLEESKNETEDFMHFTLRPILKFQHPLLVRCIKAGPHFQHLKFITGKETRNRDILTQFIQQNKSLKYQLIGMTTGLCTETELEAYERHTKEINKRIIQMVVTRFLSQM